MMMRIWEGEGLGTRNVIVLELLGLGLYMMLGFDALQGHLVQGLVGREEAYPF